MPARSSVVIVGAGPYGLSLAAHLRDRNLDVTVFGHPMQSWADMPVGMHLKSEGFGSSLCDPRGALTLERFCATRGIAYAPIGTPVSLATFVEYGRAFKERFVPDVDERSVASIARSDGGYLVVLEDGERVLADRVVMAVGINHCAYMPPVLAALDEKYATHSSAHSDVEGLAGCDVAIIGAGGSALDLAALLVKGGARPALVTRQDRVDFQQRSPTTRPLRARLRAPLSSIGPGWAHRFFTAAPGVFRRLPLSLRLREVRTTLGPAGGWVIKNDVVGHVPFLLATSVERADVIDGRVRLTLSSPRAPLREVTFDHVIAATGFRLDIDRLSVLDPAIRDSIRRVDGAPALSSHFESSVRGLYFIGAWATNSFGPMLRFVAGTGFTSRRVARRLARTRARRGAAGPRGHAGSAASAA